MTHEVFGDILICGLLEVFAYNYLVEIWWVWKSWMTYRILGDISLTWRLLGDTLYETYLNCRNLINLEFSRILSNGPLGDTWFVSIREEEAYRRDFGNQLDFWEYNDIRFVGINKCLQVFQGFWRIIRSWETILLSNYFTKNWVLEIILTKVMNPIKV